VYLYQYEYRIIAIESSGSIRYICSELNRKNMLDVLINQSDDKSESQKALRVSDRADKPIKSLMKSVSWRIVGTIDTMVISYFITGKITLALSIGSVEVLTKTILYYFHERIWAHIHRIRLIKLHKSNRKNYEVKRPEAAVVR
jgi:uncharacterized membrane protein